MRVFACDCECVIMCLRAYKCKCGDSHSIGSVGRPMEEGVVSFRTTSADGGGGSENLDFGRTSFMNAPTSLPSIRGCKLSDNPPPPSDVRLFDFLCNENHHIHMYMPLNT